MGWKPLKRMAAYAVQYWQLVGVLWRDRKLTTAQSKLISLSETSSWGFAGLSIIIGMLALGAPNDGSVDIDEVSIASAVRKELTTILVTLAMWIVLSAVSHLVSRRLGGKGDFSATASNTVAVMSVTYVASGLAFAIGGLLVRPFFNQALSWIVPSVAFLVMQFVLVRALLPTRLKFVHALSDRATKTTRAIAILVLVGNVALAAVPALLAGVQVEATIDQKPIVVAFSIKWPDVPPMKPVWNDPPIPRLG